MRPDSVSNDGSRTRRLIVASGAALLISLAGCVSQSTYDMQVAATADLKQALAQAQLEVADLAKQVAALQAASRELETQASEARAAVQREDAASAALKQKSQDKLVALQTQMAALVTHSHTLGRSLADAKQQNASLRLSAKQTKRELDELRDAPPPPAVIPAALPVSGPAVTPASTPEAAAPTVQPTTQTAQAAPPAPAQPAAGSTPQPAATPADESWTAWLLNWLTSLWAWIFP